MKISEIITGWYKKNRRDLPWRSTSDPYRIWLSEIILQQTRISQGMSYYHRFTERFPDVTSLADAPEQEVIKLWQGLGYYSRARNLHAAARQVVEGLGGMFPASRDELLKLRGVGPYTAAAVASIAYGEPVAAVDGNVARVISRLYAISAPVNTPAGEKEISALADELLNRSDPGEHNQAMMEFGALQCVPVNPHCGSCPVGQLCMAYRAGNVSGYPVKLRKTKVKKRFFTYLLISNDGYTYIQRRTGNDIWKEMYQFPMAEHERLPAEEELPVIAGDIVGAGKGSSPGSVTEEPGNAAYNNTGPEAGRTPFSIQQNTPGRPRKGKADPEAGRSTFSIQYISEPVKHQLSHQLITARFVHVRLHARAFTPPEDWEKVRPAEVGEYPLPRLIDRYLELDDGAEG